MMEQSQITKLLSSNRVDDVFHTHVSMIKPKGKFQFNRETLEKFWDMYCTGIQNTRKGSPHSSEDTEKEPRDLVLGIAEKPQQYLPVLVDVDLKIKDEGSKMESDSLYTDEQLQRVVEIYQTVLREIVESCNDKDLTCVVLEKKMYQLTRNDIVYHKHGFHLHFPYIFLNKIDQEIQLIPRVQELVSKSKLFENLGIEDSGKVIDKGYTTAPWLLYCSRKDENKDPYKVTRIYNANLESIKLEEAFKGYKIFDNKEKPIPIKGKVKYILPRILSIIPYGRSTKTLKKGLISPLKEKMKKERKQKQEMPEMDVSEALELSRRLLPLLGDHRADDRTDWMTVGWCLYSITDGHPDALDLWCEFSSRCQDKYDENKCIHEWENNMIKKDISIGTLKYFASLDSPEEYKKFKDENTIKHVTDSLEGSHNDVAKALYAEYGDEYICASITNKIWFQFKNHIWEQVEEGTTLSEKISGKIVIKYIQACHELIDKLGTANKTDTALVNNQLKKVQKMIANLKNSNYKKSVMRECMEVFYNSVFKDNLDANPNLIAFKNGVYDFSLDVFRPGKPEDYLSKRLPINYIPFSEDDEKVHNVKTFLEQVFPNKEVRRYFMNSASDLFVGGNHEKTVNFWTGEGDNGKSVTEKFLEKMLGKFAVKMNTVNITGKKPGAGNAYADLARTGGGVRLLVLEEPDADECINSGPLKNWSGNDSFYARDLFEKGKDGREITPLFKIVFICNKLPRIKGADKAVWNRVRVIPFESVFCRPDNPAPETYEEQLRQKRFPMDKQFEAKIPNLLEAFAWVLIEHRKQLLKHPEWRVEPEEVRIATAIYQRQNDIYRQFTEECIADDPKKVLSLVELYSIFKEWLKEAIPNHPLPSRPDVEEYFTKLWGKPSSGKRWQGYRQATLKDKMDSGDVVVLEDKDLATIDEEEDGGVDVDEEEYTGLPPL